MDEPQTLGDRLRRRRKEYGWTQRELARRAGVNVSMVNRLERHDAVNPNFETILKLAKALGCTTDYLGGRESESADDQLQPAGTDVEATVYSTGSYSPS